MLSISKMSCGQEGYYCDLSAEDYYLEGGEPLGQWFGKAAEAFGLTGLIDIEIFRELFAGKLGDRNLVKNAGHPKRCPGWDLTFSAPKSVSVAWSQADPDIAKKIQLAHEAAVKKALQFVEEYAGISRRGKGGHIHEKAVLAFAMFEHGTSRAQDPQLHTHALLLNAVLRADGSTGALHSQDVYRIKMAAGAIYRAEFAALLEKDLGLIAERDGSCFQIQGVSTDLTKEFSKRREEIQSRMKELGQFGAVASERMARTTRSHKSHQSRQELTKEWKRVGQEFDWSTMEVKKLVNENAMKEGLSPELAANLSVEIAIDRITEQKNSFSERDLIRFTAEEAQTDAIGAEPVIQAVRDILQDGKQIVRLGVIENEIRYSTPEILKLEKKMIDHAKKMSESIGVPVSDRKIKAVLKKRPTINEEQAEAVRHIADCAGNIKIVTGDAGTGKTFMLDAAREVLENSGCRVIGASLAGKAARGLEEEANIESGTLRSLLFKLDKGYEKLDWNTVVVIDEAGMVGTKQMANLIEHCQKTDAKLVLVGDPKQLQAIERGGGLKALAEIFGESRLTIVIRQRNEEERKAVEAISRGNTTEALEHYAEKGRLSVAETREELRERLVADWSREGVANPKENLILCGTRLDAAILNRQAQELRLAKGMLGEESVKVGEHRLREGDRVVFKRRDPKLGIENGEFGTLLGVSETFKFGAVELDNGKKRVIPFHQYTDIKPGYAVTTHSAQGDTVDNAFILTDELMQDLEMTYVQASRVRDSAHIYTTEAEAGDHNADLARKMEKSHQKELAISEQQRAKINSASLSLSY